MKIFLHTMLIERFDSILDSRKLVTGIHPVFNTWFESTTETFNSAVNTYFDRQSAEFGFQSQCSAII